METNGIQIVQRIDEIRKNKGLTRKDVAENSSISTNTIATWLARGTIPSADIALKIANYLNVSIEWLITGHNPKELNTEEKELLRLWSMLDSIQKDTILEVIKVSAAKSKKNIKETV